VYITASENENAFVFLKSPARKIKDHYFPNVRVTN